MSEFRCPVVKIRALEPIPGADFIELAVVGDYRSVVPKGLFVAGDLAVYIPEGAVIPDPVLEILGLQGKLAGPEKNRVKAIKLRGCLSQGILLQAPSIPEPPGRYVVVTGNDPASGKVLGEGEDAADILGIVKYEPPIPASMGGEVVPLFEHTLKYDIENIKAWPDVLEPGEMIAVTEKIHGTFCCFGRIPGLFHADLFDGNVFVASKGLGAKGLVFKAHQRGNIYVDMYEALGRPFRRFQHYVDKPIWILGELYGVGVQDLHYGAKEKGFRVFDVKIGADWLGPAQMVEFARHHDLEPVPLLFLGPWDKGFVDTLVDGKETISGQMRHIREGVVIRPVRERRHPDLGRVILKHVSADYLLRKGGTELN